MNLDSVFNDFTFKRGDIVRLRTRNPEISQLFIITHLIITLGEAGPWCGYQVRAANGVVLDVLEMEIEHE